MLQEYRKVTTEANGFKDQDLRVKDWDLRVCGTWNYGKCSFFF